MTDYSSYQHLLIEKSDGIITLTMNRPETLNSTNFRLHNELSRIWLDIGADPEVRVAVVTGAGEAFSAGGDFEMIEQAIDNPAIVAQNTKEAGDIVYNILNLDKPVISAINGVAVGAGLAVALMADISIAAEDARITDGHIRLGVAAGDHAAIIWPLLCGMAKAKYYLLTCDFLDGKEAERIGLVSMVGAPRRADGNRHARRPPPGRRSSAGDPLHQARAQPVAPPGGTHLLSTIPSSPRPWVSSATT